MIDRLQALSVMLSAYDDREIESRSARNALVLSFIDALGYDILDRGEVVPRFSDEEGIGDGGSVDYAILQDGYPIMLFDCHDLGSDLRLASVGFRRYFSAIQPVVAVVTDGVSYCFHSDVGQASQMDESPFLEVDLSALGAAPLSDLEALSRRRFDPDTVWELAGTLLYTHQIHRVLSDQLDRPADDFVRFFACRISAPAVTRRDRARFAAILRHALRRFVEESPPPRQLRSSARSAPGVSEAHM